MEINHMDNEEILRYLIGRKEGTYTQKQATIKGTQEIEEMETSEIEDTYNSFVEYDEVFDEGISACYVWQLLILPDFKYPLLPENPYTDADDQSIWIDAFSQALGDVKGFSDEERDEIELLLKQRVGFE